jgi:hypothetical protein
LYHDLKTNGLNALLREDNLSITRAISSLHKALYEQVFFEFEEQNIIRDNVTKELCYLIKSDMPSEEIYQELLNKVNQSSSD